MSRGSFDARSLTPQAQAVVDAGPICDACLGGAFGQLGRGMSNPERGRAVRAALAEAAPPATGTACWVCGGLFGEVEEWARRAVARVADVEFGTYLFGMRPTPRLREVEAYFHERFASEAAEPLRHAFNRSVGKAFEALVGRGTVDFQDPDVSFTVDLVKDDVTVRLASLFLYGRYRKLVRGIPQTHWPCRRCRGRGCPACGGSGKQYPESVEEIVARPFVAAARAAGAHLHGAGREDIDARMLGTGRPFVLEIVSPRVRSLDLKALAGELASEAAGRVEVAELRWVGRDAVAQVKETRATKRYRARVALSAEVDEASLQRALTALVGEIEQRTPQRVAHRRADLVRRRRVHEVQGRVTAPREAEIELVTDGGLYVKELVSGDDGRTNPSLSALLGVPAAVAALDVMRITSSEFPDGESSSMDEPDGVA
ncbi:MAG: tRNA pseudouridine(54/55) synthase Pus10 [Candidatus Bipolaricaulis sp.]|nr:tRNA pseudouridine(54/55) synthase Pus10 [Candidatus Bipolaricaulis sp.]MDD5645947.1 tRNA pseudouridine(54/55) synthase Pus10 [Candidatus Bipolaricaulis sp.]